MGWRDEKALNESVGISFSFALPDFSDVKLRLREGRRKNGEGGRAGNEGDGPGSPLHPPLSAYSRRCSFPSSPFLPLDLTSRYVR